MRKRFLTIAAIAFASFAGLEGLVRLATQSLDEWGDWYTVDPIVGHLPREGLEFTVPFVFHFSIGAHGTRNNGAGPPPPSAQPILAVGDSYTFGQGVSDEQTWPALLEKQLGRRVINAGVTGFGLDQTILRAELLTPVYQPHQIVVSFILDNIDRARKSMFAGNAKPRFDLSPDGSLFYVPAPGVAPAGALKRVLRKSLVLTLFASDVLYREGDDVTHDVDANLIACRLIERLGKLRSAVSEIVVIAQPASVDELADARAIQVKDLVLDCARSHGLSAIDTFGPILALMPALRAQLYDGHMTSEGNQFIANILAHHLRSSALHEAR